MHKEPQQVHNKADRCRVRNVPRGIHEHRQSVFSEHSLYYRVHRAFIICDHLYVSHPVAEVADKMPYICSSALRLIIRIGSAYHCQVISLKPSVLSPLRFRQAVVPQTPFDAPDRFCFVRFIFRTDLPAAERQIHFTAFCPEHALHLFIESEITSVEYEVHRLCSRRQLKHSPCELRCDAVISVYPYILAAYHTGLSDCPDVHGYIVLGISVLAGHLFLVCFYYTSQLLKLGSQDRIGVISVQHCRYLIKRALLLLEFRDKIAEHGGEGLLSRRPSEDVKVLRMLFDEPRQEHESSVSVQHVHRLSPLFGQEPQPQPAH